MRLRLSEDEILKLREERSLEESLSLSPANALRYRLEIADAPYVSGSLEGDLLRVVVPSAASDVWITSGATELDAPVAPGSVAIIIERDLDRTHKHRRTRP